MNANATNSLGQTPLMMLLASTAPFRPSSSPNPTSKWIGDYNEMSLSPSVVINNEVMNWLLDCAPNINLHTKTHPQSANKVFSFSGQKRVSVMRPMRPHTALRVSVRVHTWLPGGLVRFTWCMYVSLRGLTPLCQPCILRAPMTG